MWNMAVALAEAPVLDATVRPSPLSAIAFAFLALATVGLILSMLRHLRRVRANLGGPPVDPE
jgi:hypothetical protein